MQAKCDSLQYYQLPHQFGLFGCGRLL